MPQYRMAEENLWFLISRLINSVGKEHKHIQMSK